MERFSCEESCLSAVCSVSLKRRVNFFMVSLYHFLGICKVNPLMMSFHRYAGVNLLSWFVLFCL